MHRCQLAPGAANRCCSTLRPNGRPSTTAQGCRPLAGGPAPQLQTDSQKGRPFSHSRHSDQRTQSARISRIRTRRTTISKMSADDTLSLIAQPLYYGPEAYGAVPKGSLSAEHFLLRVAELQLKFSWTEKKMLDMALSYMRGPARDYFNHQVKMTLNKTDLRNIMTSWPHFKMHFKETFFVLRNKRDIAFGWSALTQTSSERSDEFFNRICRAVNEAMEIMPYPPAPEMTLPQELVDVCTAKKTVRDQTLQLINAYFKDAIAMADDRWRQTWVIVTVQRGLRDPQLKKMIDKEQQKDSDLRTISLLLIHAESQRTPAPKNMDAPSGRSRGGLEQKEA